MSVTMKSAPPLVPPAEVPEIQRGNWLDLPADDPVVEYVVETLWDNPAHPASWATARLSGAAYVYREAFSQWGVVAKFYTAKASSSPHKYASREWRRTRRAAAAGLDRGEARVVKLLGLWRGALFLEYVQGLRLEDVIAVRQSQPGRLAASLEQAARFLVSLHIHTGQPHYQPKFESYVTYAHRVVEQLAGHGVLQYDPIAVDGITRLIDHWASEDKMRDFAPVLTHGDTTTTNFLFPERGGVVVVDWERLRVGDPAFDLGRLMAEITHSINQHGGSVVEAEPFVHRLVEAYRQALPVNWDAAALVDRARFYRASSTLRIARNGWVSRLDRTALVAQAMALLAHDF